MKECLYAYTETPYKGYPGYVNVSRTESGDYEVTVRSKKSCAAGYLRLSAERFRELAESLSRELRQSLGEKG